MSPVHVVHVLHSMATGGLEKGVATLVTHSSPDVKHTVVCLSRSGPMAEQLPPGTSVIEMDKQPGNSFRFLWRLSRRLKALRPDVVHTRNWGGLDGVIASRMFGHRGVIHGEHGWEMADASGSNLRRRRVRRFLSRWVAEYTCVSRDMKTWLKDAVGIRQPVTQVYNGVDTDRFKPRDAAAKLRAELRIEPGAFVVGIVSRLDAIKDHATLFRAVAAVRAGGIDATLLVVGSGPEDDRLRGKAGEGVRFLGARTDIPEVLRALDVFVLTSVNEGISNTILEAMATGLPVVATRVGGNPELIEADRCGVLVEAGDDRAIAEALARYAREGERARAHGEAARSLALDRFSIRSMVGGYEEVWRRVAPSRSASG